MSFILAESPTLAFVLQGNFELMSDEWRALCRRAGDSINVELDFEDLPSNPQKQRA